MLDRRYEEKLSRQERKAFEAEKLSTMTFKEKVEYFWSYYKILFFLPVCLICIVWFGLNIYKSATANTILQLAIVNSAKTEHDDLLDEYRNVIGADKSSSKILINSNLHTEPPEDQMAFSAFMAGETLDVVVCQEEFYVTNRDIFDEHIVLTLNDQISEKLGIQYETVYLGIVFNTQNLHNSEAFLEIVSSWT